MPELLVYIDGACLGNPGPGGWGVRMYYPDGEVRELGGATKATTNNRMELQGAIAALQEMDGHSPATIFTDSRYVIDGITKWLPNWRRHNWVTASKTPVKNRDLWVELDALHHAGISWQHVRGHSGDPNNERVDDIARAFSIGKTPALFCGKVGAAADPVATAPGRDGQTQAAANTTPWYVTIAHGAIIIDTHKQQHLVRLQTAPDAVYTTLHTLQELIAFCATHGAALPPNHP